MAGAFYAGHPGSRVFGPAQGKVADRRLHTPTPAKGIYSGMAHPRQEDDDRDLKGLRRANRDDEQHWRDKGWEKIEGGRDSSAPKDPKSSAPGDRPVIGADYTRSPFDPSLVRDERGNLRDDRADCFHGYG